MSWLSSGLKKLRKSVGLPPITLRTVLAPAAQQIPIVGGPIAAAINAARGSKVTAGVAAAKSEVESAIDRAALIARTGTAVTNTMDDASAAARNPVVLAGAAAVALYLITRGRR